MKSSLIDRVFEETLKYLECMPKIKRKEIGQFFTSVETARYMASMFSVPTKSDITILDAGAGSGILTAAVVDRLQKEPIIKHIRITCYETDESVLPILKDNLNYLRENSKIPLDYEIKEENYITSQSDDFNSTIFANKSPVKYDWIIGNPPYKKIAKDAAEATSMPTVCYGAPNLYFLFTAMGLFNLDNKGEQVYIIPRSWTSGAYFKSFRKYLLGVGVLKHIHLFVSRDKVFEKECVLQETIIIKVDKSGIRDKIKMTASNSNSDFEKITTIEVPYEAIVFGVEKYVYLVTSAEELQVLNIMSKWKDTLPSLKMKMKTGLTVDFRNRKYLRNEPDKNVVPLLYSQHIKDGRVEFPIQKEYEYVTTEKSGLIQKNKNYLLVKRFTSKEEKRRLQCGIYLSKNLPEYEQISTQNKVNFIDGLTDELSVELVYGLYVLFNSTIYDLYYRILNGSTQVNSTEANAMPIPPLNDIIDLGIALLKEKDLSVKTCDKVLGVLING